MSLNLTKLIQNREINYVKQSNYKLLNCVFSNFEYSSIQEHSFHDSINHLSLDHTNCFMIISDAGGNVHIYEIIDDVDGYLEFINRKDLLSVMIHRSQWLPNDNGMFAVTQPKIISLINSNTFQIVDTYDFKSKSVIYWSDWNENDENLIAVALSNSCIRLIDIRAGNCVHTITTKSPVQTKSHNITRILWAPFDKDCFFAGDSCGYIHLYDIRRSKKAIQLVGEDYTSIDPICSMDFNPSKTNLITNQGRNNPLTTVWSYRNKKLRNTNVNFSLNKEDNRRLFEDQSAFIRYQIHVTDHFLFKPFLNSFKEISVFELSTGKNLNTFETINWDLNSLCDASCVLGLYNDYNILYSGSKRKVKVWNRKIITDHDKEIINRIHQDNWSDSD